MLQVRTNNNFLYIDPEFKVQKENFPTVADLQYMSTLWIKGRNSKLYFW